jgi:hypothetical protein
MGMSYSFIWRDQIIKDRTLSSTTKHVAMMLHYHMDNNTGECFPSEKLIAEEASLSPRSVATHIKILSEKKYITIEKKRGGQGWNRNCYRGLLHSKDNSEVDTYIKDDADSSKDDANDDIKVMKEMHINSSYNSSKNSNRNLKYLNEFWKKYPEELKPDFDLFKTCWIKNNYEDYGDLIIFGLNQWIDNNWFEYQLLLPIDFLKHERWHEDRWPMF